MRVTKVALGCHYTTRETHETTWDTLVAFRQQNGHIKIGEYKPFNFIARIRKFPVSVGVLGPISTDK